MEKPDDWESLTFQQKIQYYAKNLTEDYAPYVDKLSAKKIVKSICGDDIKIAKVIRVLSGPSDIHSSDIQSGRILKSAHASRWNILLHNGISKQTIQTKLFKYNRQFTINGEKQYTYLKPCFFIEETIEDSLLGKNQMAIPYMFHCIRGVPVYIRTEVNQTHNTYELDWTPIEIVYNIPKPNCLEKMISLSKKLSEPFEYVRIDFFLGKNDTIYFSEYTFTPAGGTHLKTPVDDQLTKLWSR